MVYFVNKIQLSDQKYQANETVGYDIYKGKFLFLIKDFVSFGINCQSMYFMSTRFLKGRIDGVRVPQFQITYIHNTTYSLLKIFVKICCEVHYMCWGDQEL